MFCFDTMDVCTNNMVYRHGTPIYIEKNTDLWQAIESRCTVNKSKWLFTQTCKSSRMISLEGISRHPS